MKFIIFKIARSSRGTLSLKAAKVVDERKNRKKIRVRNRKNQAGCPQIL
jgi:hypothetical protein